MSFCSWSGQEVFRDHLEKGIYVCSRCDSELFHSSSKYEHHTPWPAFTNTVHPDSISRCPESATAIKNSKGRQSRDIPIVVTTRC